MTGKQKLIIRFEHEYGATEAVFETDVISAKDEIFWEWLTNCWDGLGISFVKEALKK